MDNNISNNNRMKYSAYMKSKNRRSTFEELSSMELSNDKRIVISLKSNESDNFKKISIAQAVTIIPEGKDEYVEIFYPHALTLSLQQAEEFVSKLIAEIALVKKQNKMV